MSSLLGVITEYNSNHAQKWGQICCKSVQLVRGSFFWNDLLQNPYFSNYPKCSKSLISVSNFLWEPLENANWAIVFFFHLINWREYQISFSIIQTIKPLFKTKYIYLLQGRRNVWGHKDWSSPCFQDSVNPISTREADYAHHSTTVLTMLKYVPAALQSV